MICSGVSGDKMRKPSPFLKWHPAGPSALDQLCHPNPEQSGLKQQELWGAHKTGSWDLTSSHTAFTSGNLWFFYPERKADV